MTVLIPYQTLENKTSVLEGYVALKSLACNTYLDGSEKNAKTSNYTFQLRVPPLQSRK